MPDLVEPAEIAAAAAGLAGVAVVTPLLPSPWSQRLWLKPESLQPVGAFKIRGAYHALRQLPEDLRSAGVVTHSSGNHGQALAYAASRFGVPCVVVMPEQAAPHKLAATRRLGAEVVLVPAAERAARAEELAAARGLHVISPFDHRDVIIGQGTVGLEIANLLAAGFAVTGPAGAGPAGAAGPANQQDLPYGSAAAAAPAGAGSVLVLVPVGGGGLAAGVATAVKGMLPGARVVGVEPALAAEAQESLAAGELRHWPIEQVYATVADGLRAQVSELTLAHLAAHLDGIVTVTEEEILETTGALVRQARLVVEPSGAVATAAYRHRRSELPAADLTVAVISGGNLDPALLARLAVG